MNFLKKCYCQYPGCKIYLGEVHIATKFCPLHRYQKRKQDAQTRHREQYKSKFHRARVSGGDYKNPKLLPRGLKERGPCPGNGNGWCGAILRRERAMNGKGSTTNYFDFFCGTHRFPDPQQEKN